MKWAQKQKGFTIVELLIVVVVIAILAAITIVAYTGIQNRTKESSLMSSVSQAVKKIETFKSANTSETYPTTAAQAGLSNVTGLTFLSNADQANYCVQVVNGQLVYSATKDTPIPIKKSCGENGLIGWWQFNGNGNDTSGNNANATTTGVFAVGQNGQAASALEFNGTTPTSSITGSEGILTPYNTFSFWYNANSWSGTPATSFIAKRGGPTTGHFIMRLTSSGTLVVDCGGQNNRWNSGYTLPLSAWTHIVVTCTPNSVAAYVNGTSVGIAAQTTGPLANNALLQFAQDGSNGYALTGRMDDIRLYNRALGAAEAQKLFTDGAQ